MTDIVLPRHILYAERAADAVARVAEELNARRILVVTDRVISGLAFYRQLIDALKGYGYTVYEFSDVEPEPSVETGRRVAEAAKKISAELIVAVGGGSVIDAAKAGWLVYENPSVNLESVNPFTRYGLGRKAKLIAIPTTSGTGSDVSFGVVLSKKIDEDKRKLAMGSPELVPYATVLDVEAVKGMPRHLTLYTGVDALAHAVEAYVANTANPFSDALAEKVVEIVFTSLPRVLSEPGDEQARLAMHIAATMAGAAFTASGLGLAHAIAHALGPALGLHHGLAVGLALPYVIDYNSKTCSRAREKYDRLKRILETLASLPPRPSLKDHVLALYEETGFPKRVGELEKPPTRDQWEKMIEKIAENALQDPELAFNPAPVGPDDVKSLLREMY